MVLVYANQLQGLHDKFTVKYNATPCVHITSHCPSCGNVYVVLLSSAENLVTLLVF